MHAAHDAYVCHGTQRNGLFLDVIFSPWRRHLGQKNDPERGVWMTETLLRGMVSITNGGEAHSRADMGPEGARRHVHGLCPHIISKRVSATQDG